MKNKRQFMKGRNSLCAIFFLLFFSLRLLAGEVAGKKNIRFILEYTVEGGDLKNRGCQWLHVLL